MPPPLKRNAVTTLCLAVLFYLMFMFAKHDPALRPVIPFGDDPYDAVGSFGVIVAMIVAVIALVRALRPYRKEPPSRARRVYLIRSELAVVLAVLITLGADIIALARHPAMWVGAASRNELLMLLGGLAIAAIATLVSILHSREDATGGDPKPAIVVTIAAALVLIVYPERLIQAPLTHLLTVVIGAVILFAPMRPILTALVPYDPTGTRPRNRWLIALIVGIGVGAFAFIGEMGEGGGHVPLRQFVVVATVFVGLAIAGLLVAYAFLGKPLGFAGE